MLESIHHTRMRVALEEAHLAQIRNEVPIGAIAVHHSSGEILARAGNRTREYCDPTAHAEMQIIRDICRYVRAQRAPEFDIYITLEPCPMCAAALSYARVKTIYYGANDPKSGALTSALKLYSFAPLHHKPKVIPGVLEDECAQIITGFFEKKRIDQKSIKGKNNDIVKVKEEENFE